MMQKKVSILKRQKYFSKHVSNDMKWIKKSQYQVLCSFYIFLSKDMVLSDLFFNPLLSNLW